jgi:hypothetical protein
MEQDQGARVQEQAGAWVEAAVAGVREVALRQAPADTASARTVGKEYLINWGLPAIASNALSAERL